MLHAEFLHDLVRLLLLEKDVRLHLVDGGLDRAEIGKVDQAVGVKVAHADRAYLAGMKRIFHGAVSAVVVAEGLVDEQQIDVVRP